jgi:hypothetical protein
MCGDGVPEEGFALADVGESEEGGRGEDETQGVPHHHVHVLEAHLGVHRVQTPYGLYTHALHHTISHHHHNFHTLLFCVGIKKNKKIKTSKLTIWHNA